MFTHHELTVVPGRCGRVHEGDVAAVHAKMVDAAAGRNIWIVGGGDLAGQFADAGLLDEVIVYVAPVTLGGGQAAPPAQRRAASRGDGPERRLRHRALRGGALAQRHSIETTSTGSATPFSVSLRRSLVRNDVPMAVERPGADEDLARRGGGSDP